MKKIIPFLILSSMLCGCSTLTSLWRGEDKIVEQKITNDTTDFISHPAPIDPSNPSAPVEPIVPPAPPQIDPPSIPTLPELPIDIDMGGQSHACHSHG